MSVISLASNPNILVSESIDGLSIPSIPRTSRAAIICDPIVSHLHPHLAHALSQMFNCVLFRILPHREPAAEDVHRLAAEVATVQPHVVVSVGGGSSIDTGKGLCCIVPGGYSLPARFECPGAFRTVLKHVAFVTTSGPGAESSPAMVYSLSHGGKCAIADERLIPNTVVIIPALLATLPPFETACCVFDGIVHSLESLLAEPSSHFVRPLNVTALRIFLTIVPSVLRDPADLRHREQLACASILSSTALRATGAGPAHALSAGLSSLIKYPHGGLVAVCMLCILRQDMEHCKVPRQLNHLAEELGFTDIACLVSYLSDILEEQVLRRRRLQHDPFSDAELRACAETISRDPRLGRHITSFDEARIWATMHTIVSTIGR